jgi:signal transduction histidine kinase
VPWVAPALYLAVLLAGGYAAMAGLGPASPRASGLFLGGLAVLFVLDAAERRRWPVATPALPAGLLLATRAALFLVVAAGDRSGLSRILFVLLPFTAYFAFGRPVSIAVAIGCVGVVVVIYQLTAAHWYADKAYVSDLLMFAVGLALTVLMAAVAVRERDGRQRVAELSAAAERNRMARDIHDELGHRLTAIAVLLEKAEAFRGRDPAVADQALRDARDSARQALDGVRRSVRTLRADELHPGQRDGGPFRLGPAVAELVRGADTGRPAIVLDVAGDEIGYDERALTALYRAAQEGITNARRHADAGQVRVSLAFDRAGARLVVADDGRGFATGNGAAAHGDAAGFGLAGMRERVRLVGGSVEVDSVEVDSGAGTGTRLVVTVPRARS